MLDAEATRSSYSWKRDPLLWACSVLMFLPIILVFVFYNYWGLELLVYVGWIVLALGLILFFLAGYEFRRKGGAPKGDSVVHTTVLIDSGIYAVVRHPQYLCFIMLVFAFVLMSQHLLSVFSGVTGSVLFYLDVLREEHASIKKFGEAYKRYMQRVPRMNLLLGVVRLLRRRKRE